MSNNGYLMWATQSAKGTGNTADGQRVYCTDINSDIPDITRARRPSIGGKAFPQDTYKAGTSGGFTISMEVPGENIGYLLYYLSGDVSVASDTPETGVDTHTFKMAADDFSLPWFTALSDTENLIYVQLVDSVMLSGRFMFQAGDAMQAQMAAASITPSFGSAASTPDDDDSPILVCSTADALFQLADTDVEANQVVVDFTNVAAPAAQEMKIGSPYRRDISKLARACRVTVRRWVDATVFKAVYFGGSTTWSATPYTAKTEVAGASGANISGSTTKYSLQFTAGEVGFNGCRAPQRAQTITLMEMQGDVVIPSSGEEFQFDLVTADAMDFTAVPS